MSNDDGTMFDDFSHYYKATQRLTAEVAQLRAERDALAEEVKKLKRVCARCSSSDRSLDIDFHCSTCWRNLQAERDEAESSARESITMYRRARDRTDHYPKTLAALVARVEELEEILRTALSVLDHARPWKRPWAPEAVARLLVAFDLALRPGGEKSE